MPVGELTLDGLAGEAPAGIGVLESGPIASGSQVDVDAGDISPSIPVTVCGNGIGVLGDASAACAPAQPSTGPGGASAGTGSSSTGSLLDSLASGSQVDAGIGDISPSVPVTVCGNSAGVLGDASANCGASGGVTTPGSGSGVDLDTILDTVLDTSTGGITDPDIGMDVGIGGDISTGGIIAPTPPGIPPGTTPGRTDTVGTPGAGASGPPGSPGPSG